MLLMDVRVCSSLSEILLLLRCFFLIFKFFIYFSLDTNSPLALSMGLSLPRIEIQRSASRTKIRKTNKLMRNQIALSALKTIKSYGNFKQKRKQINDNPTILRYRDMISIERIILFFNRTVKHIYFLLF